MLSNTLLMLRRSSNTTLNSTLNSADLKLKPITGIEGIESETCSIVDSKAIIRRLVTKSVLIGDITTKHECDYHTNQMAAMVYPFIYGGKLFINNSSLITIYNLSNMVKVSEFLATSVKYLTMGEFIFLGVINDKQIGELKIFNVIIHKGINNFKSIIN